MYTYTISRISSVIRFQQLQQKHIRLTEIWGPLSNAPHETEIGMNTYSLHNNKVLRIGKWFGTLWRSCTVLICKYTSMYIYIPLELNVEAQEDLFYMPLSFKIMQSSYIITGIFAFSGRREIRWRPQVRSTWNTIMSHKLKLKLIYGHDVVLCKQRHLNTQRSWVT
jgi:hypothetical protein